MSVLDPPCHPIVRNALDLAGILCHGHTIGEAPAMRHAVLVARLLARHVPDVAAKLVAAALLHDAPDFAPAGADLDALLDTTVTPGVAPLVRALRAEHERMDSRGDPQIGDRDVTLVIAADMAIAFRSLVIRARRSGDEAAFWGRRAALRDQIPYFRGWAQLAQSQLPQGLRLELDGELDNLGKAISAALSKGPEVSVAGGAAAD